MNETDAIDDDIRGPGRGRQGSALLAGLHWMAWLFVLFALGDLLWFVVNANFGDSGPSIADLAVYGLQVFPAVVAILFPAVLLARNRDAPTRLPVLLLGTILFALFQGLLVLGSPLQGAFETATPPSEELPNLVPLSAAYDALTLFTAAAGLGLMARGLSLARRYEDRHAAAIELIVPVAAVLATVFGIVALTRLDLPDGPIPAAYILVIGTNVVLGVLRVAVWAYLLTSALRGWLAGDEPESAWGLAAVGSAVVLLALGILNVTGVLDIQNETLTEAVGWVTILAYAAGHLALLVAFALGLPTLDEADEESSDPDAWAEDDAWVDDDARVEDARVDDSRVSDTAWEDERPTRGRRGVPRRGSGGS